MLLEILRDSLSILDMAVHAQAQGLDALNGLPGVERRLASTNIPQDMHARLDGKRREARTGESRVYESMIRRIGRIEVFELAIAPIIIATIHNDATDGGAMSADELGGRVGDDVGAPLEWTKEIRRGEGIVNHQDQLVFSGDLRHFLKGQDCQVRVAQRFAKDNLCVWADCLFEILRVGWVDQGDFDSKLGQGIGELVVGTAIQTAGRNDMVTGTAQCENGLYLRGVTGTCSQRGHT